MNTRPVVHRGSLLVATGATALLLGVLVWYLPTPGYTYARLLLFVGIGSSAVTGLAGVAISNGKLTLAGIGGLILLGIWQAVLSVFIFPVIFVLAVSALLDAELRK